MKSVYYCAPSKGLKSRFVENLKLCQTIFHEENSNINIYKYPLKQIQNYIISIDRLDQSAMSFIAEFKDTHNIFIDSTHDESYLNYYDAIDGVKYLINTDAKPERCINVSKFINYHLFNQNNTASNRKNIVAVFLNNTTEIPYNLLKHINTENLPYRIRLFDNSSIKHPHNLGLLSEIDKAEILKTYSYFISLSNNYIYEALMCGITLLNIKNLQEIITNDIDIKQAVPMQDFINGYLL